MYDREINTKMRQIPEYVRMEVLDYMNFLLKKYKGKEIKASKFSFDWEGGLAELGKKFSSVDLQHKALEWR